MSLLSFPAIDRPGGCVHVMPCENGGYEVSHESSSGDSWGALDGPYQLAETAIAMAHSMARETYGGCRVSICAEALHEVQCGASLGGHPYQLGDF